MLFPTALYLAYIDSVTDGGFLLRSCSEKLFRSISFGTGQNLLSLNRRAWVLGYKYVELGGARISR